MAVVLAVVLLIAGCLLCVAAVVLLVAASKLRAPTSVTLSTIPTSEAETAAQGEIRRTP